MQGSSDSPDSRKPLRRRAAPIGDEESRLGDLPASAVFPAGPDAPAAAREFVVDLGLPLDRTTEEHLELMVSEVVTNSVRHAGVEPGSPIKVNVARVDDRTRVEVVDGGIGFDGRTSQVPEDLIGGWGLHIVDRLADDWGCADHMEFGVWFELAENPQDGPATR